MECAYSTESGSSNPVADLENVSDSPVLELDLVPEDEPLALMLQSHSSRESRLSLSRGAVDTASTPSALQSLQYAMALTDAFSSASGSPLLSLCSCNDSCSRTSLGNSQNDHALGQHSVLSVLSARYQQMIEDLEYSQEISLSHLATWPGISAQQQQPLASSQENGDVPFGVPLSLSHWLQTSVSRMKRHRVSSIDELLMSHPGSTNRQDLPLTFEDFPDPSDQLSQLQELSKHVNFSADSSSFPLAGWKRLRQFLMRRRSI